MSFYPELDDLNLQDLITRFRQPRHDIYLMYPDEVDLYYAEVAWVITQQGDEGGKFLLDEVRDADTARLRGILSALAFRKFDRLDLSGLFLSHLSDRRPIIVMEAIDGLSGQEVREALGKVLPLFNHESPYVRGSVLRYMRRLYPNESFALLVTALKDPHNIVRDNAIDELDELNNPEALPFLYLLLDDPHPDTRQAAQTAIKNLKDA